MITTALGLVMIAVAFIIFPIVIEGAETARTHASIASYTGLSSLVKIGPTKTSVGLLFGGVVTSLFGGRSMMKGRSGR